MKPLGIKSYGSIPHLRGSRVGPGDYHISEGQANIATVKTRDRHDLVIVQEKLDGSNVSTAKINGEIIALTRAGYLASTSPYLQHHLFGTWVKRNEQRFREVLQEGERLVGEWLAMAAGTRYNLPHEPFVAFDLMAGKEHKTYTELIGTVKPYDFVTPWVIHQGGAYPVDAALKVIETSSHGAIDPVEGAVWRVERKGKVDFLCKYVHHFKQDGKYFAEQTGQGELWNIDISAAGV